MKCRPGCGACCIAISISSPIPGMPHGKPAGVRCVNLTKNNICAIHGRGDYPEVCRDLVPSKEMCGGSFEEAFRYLSDLEFRTRP
ncbi:MAG: YkgJ family cysteine cluster protein [Spirochaetes bacterium]|nr:YkgJ family cysteine cluster protein [Spirochaetota bacterium]